MDATYGNITPPSADQRKAERFNSEINVDALGRL
jgi:hypothetical protein